jgi:hypothetical protein
MAEDRAAGKNLQKEKKKWKFLQKYYHKGAFYVVIHIRKNNSKNFAFYVVVSKCVSFFVRAKEGEGEGGGWGDGKG